MQRIGDRSLLPYIRKTETDLKDGTYRRWDGEILRCQHGAATTANDLRPHLDIALVWKLLLYRKEIQNELVPRIQR